MNIIVCILQVLLALWNVAGGIYMSMHYPDLINQWASVTIPSFFWISFGVIQILFSLGLILSLIKKFRKLATVSAVGLAIIALLGIPFYATYTGFPGMLWGIIPAVLLVFVAYWRGARK